MKNKSAISAAMVFISLLALALPVMAGSQDSEAKASMKYWLGTWETEYEYPGMGTIKEVATYTMGGENTINMTLKVYQGDKEIDQGKGWIKYDAEKDILYSEVDSEAMGEVYTSREISREGDVIWMEGEGGASMPHYRIKMTVLDEDSFDWSMYVPAGEDWNELMTVTYHRKK